MRKSEQRNKYTCIKSNISYIVYIHTYIVIYRHYTIIKNGKQKAEIMEKKKIEKAHKKFYK